MTTISNPSDQYWFLYSRFLGLPAPFPAFLVLGSSAVYLLLVYVIWPTMKPTTEAGIRMCKNLRFYHNVALFLFSAFVFFTTAVYLFQEGELLSQTKIACNPIPDWMFTLQVLFILSKVWEWGDTMFLVLLRPAKEKSFLHVYHHTTTTWLFIIMTDFPGGVKSGLLMNGFVHALMYAHYAWPFPKPLVPFITGSQIIQLMSGMYLWSITPGTCPRFAAFPSDHFFEYVSFYAFTPVYLIFFVHFFAQRWVFGGARKRTGGAPKDSKAEE